MLLIIAVRLRMKKFHRNLIRKESRSIQVRWIFCGLLVIFFPSPQLIKDRILENLPHPRQVARSYNPEPRFGRFADLPGGFGTLGSGVGGTFSGMVGGVRACALSEFRYSLGVGSSGIWNSGSA